MPIEGVVLRMVECDFKMEVTGNEVAELCCPDEEGVIYVVLLDDGFKLKECFMSVN